MQRPWTLALGAVLLALLASALVSLPLAEGVCPKCGAPLEPGAAFCTRCGARLGPSQEGTQSAPAQAAPNSWASVVQVVAVYNTELTSAYLSIERGTKLELNSILGSAVAVAPGEFITESRLLAGARDVTLHTASGHRAPARVVGIDAMIGVALLAADLPEVPPVVERTGDRPRLGESLSAVGFPARRTPRSLSSTSGVLSAPHRGEIGIHPVEDYVQTDAALPAGFAGAAMVDAQGRLVGLCADQIEAGIGLSIPVAWVDRALAWIRGGRPARAWIGLHTAVADADLRRLYGLPPEARRVVDVVFPDSPAAKAGMKRGDGLLAIQGEEAGGLAQLHLKLMDARLGDTWAVELSRRQERLKLPVTLAARPERPSLTALDALHLFGGFEVAPKGRDLLAVTRVMPGSPAADEKIGTGDVLQSLFVKKDLEHAQRNTARWRTVNDLKDLETFVGFAYSELDFYLGLRFRCRDGSKRDLFLFQPLTATNAI